MKNDNQTLIYEIKAYNEFLKRFPNIKKSILAENQHSPFDCIIQDQKDKYHLVELKRYNSLFLNNTRININYCDDIITPKFTCNFQKFINLYDEYQSRKDQITNIYGVNLFDDYTSKIELSHFFDEIIPLKENILKYKKQTLNEHLKIYYKNNQGKSQVKFGKSYLWCVFQENASSHIGVNQEFKIAFL